MAVTANRIARISLNAIDPETLAAFFIAALNFAPIESRSNACLALGETRLDILKAQGKPYPADVPAWSPLFQHIAVATSDMDAAMNRLRSVEGWRRISVNGPEQLPANTGGVTAFKFRDPEGHPLELISFPDEPPSTSLFLRIDHSAISVGDTSQSEAFYRRFGLTAGSRSLNEGVEQERLDDVAQAKVDVTALDFPSEAGPHIELLCYHGAFDPTVSWAEIHDVAATRLMMLAPDEPPGLLRDPDGHLVEIVRA